MFRSIKKIKIKKKWRKLNSHNYTDYCEVFGDIKKIHIGNYTYGEIYVSSPNTSPNLYIGNFCSIGGEVRFLLGVDHPINYVSTYPFSAKIFEKGIDAITKGDIIIEDDVWIGQGSIILSGVHIGQGAVIAAGAVVTHDVPPYAVVGGIPAKVLKYRFSEKTISFLCTLDYSRLTTELIYEHMDDLRIGINELDVVSIQERFSWFPKR